MAEQSNIQCGIKNTKYKPSYFLHEKLIKTTTLFQLKYIRFQ